MDWGSECFVNHPSKGMYSIYKKRIIDLISFPLDYVMFFAPQVKCKVYVYFIVTILFNDNNNNNNNC